MEKRVKVVKVMLLAQHLIRYLTEVFLLMEPFYLT